MSYPISCNECRRRKIKCDKVDPCINCAKKGIECLYPSKFRSTEISKIKPREPQHETKLRGYQTRIKQLESKLAITEDLISIFDTAGSSDYMKYFGANSINGLEYSMMAGILSFDNDVIKMKAINHQKKDLPVLVENNPEANMKMIRKVVAEFFDPTQFSYFNDVVSKEQIDKFLDSYDSITYWEHDEDMMLVIVVILDVLKNFLSSRVKGPMMNNQMKKLQYLITYYYQITKTQPVDSLNLVKTQVILLNYYYYTYDFTRSWKLLFQIISNSYSLGLHITQGRLWLKINVLESILCGVTSRPNILPNSLMRRDTVDEFGEFEFAALLRLKNNIHVDSYIHKRSVNYAKIKELDLKFDAFAGLLEQKRNNYQNRLDMPDGYSNEALQRDKLDLQKIYFLMMMSLSFQLNLHHEFFEVERESDKKTLYLIQKYCGILRIVIKPNELHKTREKLAALECLTYQFFLIYLKYLNFKAVRAILMVPDNNENQLKSELQILGDIQVSINDIFTENPSYSNVRILKVIEVIRSLKIDELNASSLVKKSTTSSSLDASDNSENVSDALDFNTASSVATNYDSPDPLTFSPINDYQRDQNFYSNAVVRSILENTQLVNGLRDVSTLAPVNLEEFLENR